MRSDQSHLKLHLKRADKVVMAVHEAFCRTGLRKRPLNNQGLGLSCGCLMGFGMDVFRSAFWNYPQ
jgi:hypothetical protein